MRRGAVAEAIRRHRLIVVLRRVEPLESLLALVDDLATAGARVFEVTFDAPTAERDLGRLRDHLGDGHLVGAGTVRTRAQLAAARSAGADFAVAPLLDADLVARSTGDGMPFIPGAFSPTEIAGAWAAGATFVKLFPASALGPGFIRELRGPMPEVDLIPTGGVGRENGAAFLDAGAAAVGIGGALLRATADDRRSLVRALSA